MKQTILYGFWQARNEREKRVLTVAAILLVSALVYAFIWQPGESAITRLHASLPKLRAQTELMRRQAIEIASLSKRIPAQDSVASRKSDIEASARAHKLFSNIKALSVDDSGRAQLSMDAVPFQLWIIWVAALQHDNHLRLETCHIKTATQPGMVAVEATLTGQVVQ